MGKLKLGSDLFTELAEQKRNQKFLDDWGIKRQRLSDTRKFGLVKDFQFVELGPINREDCLYVQKAGTPVDEVIINTGVAIDKFANLIINSNPFNLQIPNNGQWYWIKSKYKMSNEESGTVSVDILGNLTGLGTEFDNILRGQPNFPSKIRFLNSTSGNGNDYEVVKVAGATSAILAGDFIAETGLKFAVVGTFTPGYIVPTTDELIFNYDSIDLQLIQETTLNTRPPFLAGEEFYIARVRNNGVTLQLEDKRIEWFWSQGEYLSQYLNRLTHVNPLIGVESIKYNLETNPKNTNLAYLGFGFRFKSYTIDTSSKKISILIGEGGKYKDTSFFTTGDFNDWRLYSKNGNWQTIIDSQKSGTQIVLTLDVLDIDEYGTADMLFVTPPFEEIEIKFSKDGSIIDSGDVDGNANFVEPFPYPSIEQIFTFNINTPSAKCEVEALKTCYNYNVTFRYKTFLGYTDWLQLPNDTIGYYNETSFDIYGNIKANIVDRTRVPYVSDISNGFIRICPSPASYQSFQDQVLTGDLFGVDHKLIANTAPILNLVVGTSRQYQMFDDTGSTLALTADSFIVLKSLTAAGATLKNGNNFLIQFKQKVSAATFKLRIVYNFVNPSLGGYILLKEFTPKDFEFLNTSEQGLMFRCTYDGAKWLINNVNESQYDIKHNNINQQNVLSNINSGTAFVPLGVSLNTPNDGTTRKYNIFFKCNISGSNGTNNNNVQFTLNQAGSPIDFTEFLQHKNTSADTISTVVNMMTQITLPAGTLVEIQRKWIVGDMAISYAKLIIQEV